MFKYLDENYAVTAMRRAVVLCYLIASAGLFSVAAAEARVEYPHGQQIFSYHEAQERFPACPTTDQPVDPDEMPTFGSILKDYGRNSQTANMVRVAFEKSLRDVKDVDVVESLRADQKRWERAIDVFIAENFKDYCKWEQKNTKAEEAEEENNLPRSVDEPLIDLLLNRLERLLSDRLIAGAARAKEIVHAYGPETRSYIGCIVQTWFVDRPYYSCGGLEIVQRGQRLCSVRDEWDSGHESQMYLLEIVDKGRRKPIAYCVFGYESYKFRCPTAFENFEGGWDPSPSQGRLNDMKPDDEPLIMYDPFGFQHTEDDILQACLSQPDLMERYGPRRK